MNPIEQRRRSLQKIQRRTYATWFTKEGQPRAPIADPRVPWQVALVLLGGEAAHRQLGAAVLRHAPRSPCHFRPSYAASILIRYTKYLSPAIGSSTEQYLLNSLPGAMTRDIRYHGYNDNFPSLATATLALAGRLLDHGVAREHARRNLSALTTLLRRRAWLSEFNSPTYTPITLAALAETAEFADDAEVREMALHCERRVWDDVAAHWHGPTCQPAGPYSRAYECDRVAQFNSLHVPVWLTTGSDCFLDPISSLFPPPSEQVIHHSGDLKFVQGFTAAIGAAPYHPPMGLSTRLWQKRLPATAAGDCEAGTCGEIAVGAKPRILYGCSGNFTTTWLAPEFSIGSSRRPFLDGNQACAFLAIWRTRARARTLAQIRSCYAVYAVNDQRPGQPNASPLHPSGLDRDQVYDHGRSVSLQKEATVLVLYRPKLELAGLPIKRLSLQLVIPLRFASRPEIWLGREKLPGPSAQSPIARSVTLREGSTVLHFRPLFRGDHGCCRAAVTVEQENDYLLVSFFNFEAWSPRTFTERDLAETGNGFVCEVQELPALAPLEAVIDKFEQARIEDETYADRRSVQYERDGLQLSLAWCPATESVQSASINGEIVPS
jgi:hypothetical protein